MGSINRRVSDLEARATAGVRYPRSPEPVYERIRRDAAESIAESLARGEESLYHSADNGDVLTADGNLVNHYGDFHRALDERIARLDREIAELQAEEETNDERIDNV